MYRCIRSDVGDAKPLLFDEEKKYCSSGRDGGSGVSRVLRHAPSTYKDIATPRKRHYGIFFTEVTDPSEHKYTTHKSISQTSTRMRRYPPFDRFTTTINSDRNTRMDRLLFFSYEDIDSGV